MDVCASKCCFSQTVLPLDHTTFSVGVKLLHSVLIMFLQEGEVYGQGRFFPLRGMGVRAALLRQGFAPCTSALGFLMVPVWLESETMWIWQLSSGSDWAPSAKRRHRGPTTS